MDVSRLSAAELERLVKGTTYAWVADWLYSYVVKLHPDKETLREKWMAEEGDSAGDRWASVRTGDGGREVRVGERRAELQADPAGTELRVEDRWAAARREDQREAGEYPGWGAERSWGESTAWPTTGNGSTETFRIGVAKCDASPQ